MAQDPHDAQVEITIGNLLRWGVMISAGVVLASGIWYLVLNGNLPRDYRHFHSEAQDLRSVAGVLNGVLHLSCTHVIQFGLLLLIATPVARVAFTVFAFMKERDWTFVWITLLVLAILLFSLTGLQRHI
jgi:uncharacterized membrane protein